MGRHPGACFTDSELFRLSGTTLRSELQPQVSFRLEQVLGHGGWGISFYAVRSDGSASLPAVVKIIRPSVVQRAPELAELMVRKEAVALGRLNEAAFPTPFVVRLLALGSLDGLGEGLPWLALEYVHGGAEGTTLRERVAAAIAERGTAFGPLRAALAVRCIAAGLQALADVGVVHRDLTPNNVLCCGFGSRELFKLSDLGLSRAEGMTSTLAPAALGSPGYVAPEQAFPELQAAGPAADVFSFGCLIHFLLTGHDYLPARNHAHALALVRETPRRALLDSPALSPALRSQPQICAELDGWLARATRPDPTERPPSAALAQHAVQLLRSVRPREPPRTPSTSSPPPLGPRDWFLRAPANPNLSIVGVAWESDGHALAATTLGLQFWDGHSWLDLAHRRLPNRKLAGSIRRIGPGRYLLTDATPCAWIYGLGGVERALTCPEGGACLLVADGDPDLTFVGAGSIGEHHYLWSAVEGQWAPPVPLPAGARVAAIESLGADTFVVAGRLSPSAGFALRYSPRLGTLDPLSLSPLPPLVAAHALTQRSEVVLVGEGQAIVRVRGQMAEVLEVPEAQSLRACALDETGPAFVADERSIWMLPAGPAARWDRIWYSETLGGPFTSLLADSGRLVAITRDGAVVEARPRQGSFS